MPLYHLVYPLLLILQPLLTLSCLADNYIITQNLSQTLNTLKSFETESSEPVSSNSIPLEPINSSESAMKFKMTFDSEIHQSGSKSQMHFILPVFGLNTKPSKNYSNDFVMDVLEKINSDSNLFLSKHLNYTIYEHSVKNENVNKKNNTNVINVFNKNVTINVNNNVNVDYNYVQSICNNCLILRGMKKYRKYRDRAYGFKSSLESDILTGSVAEGDWSKVITILGLFELTTQGGERPEGRSELAAAMLATKDINQRKLLGDYKLQILANDTKCDPGVGVDSFFHALYTHSHTKMPMLLGSACSEVTESLAKITPYWNMVQVSFGSTAPALSDRREFPLFYRTAAPDSSHNPARLAFITRFGWETVTALSQNEDVYSLAVNDLVTKLEQANITCRATITFAENDFMEQLKMLKELDTRIIIGSFSHEVAPKIFCEAYKLGMYGSDYVWILQGNPRDLWWQNQTQCIQKQLSAAVEGLIVVSTHNAIVGNKPSISGLTNTKFISLLPTPLSPFVHQTYDAVWAIALALKETNANFSCYHYANKDMARKFFSQLGNLHFLGVSGPVAFNGADRVGITAFYQIQDGAVRNVALFDPTTDLLDFNCEDCTYIVWQGHQVPIAKRVFKLKVITIQPVAFLTIACLASVGITLAISFLAFNLYFRRLKYIKLSSPRLNNIAVVGSILVYMAVILLGLDHATLPSKSAFPTVCTARVYLLSAGFSLAFGSMFTKTYRVHRIFTRSTSSVVKNKLLQDTQLISLICMLLLIDGLIVTLWVSIDPMQRQLRNLSLEISSTDRSVVYQPQVEVCGSQFTHSWLGALYAYKGLLLIVGVYMAWETRHVKIPALNDSQYIGMSVYSVVITSVLVVVLANLISERATLAFLTITILILISTTSSLCLLFLPKIHAIVAHKDSTTDPIMHSMGLKIEFNTRRFLMDDRREVYYRVEVQNRVYHREILSLDNEISRLEKALVSDPSTASSSHSSVASRKGEMTPLDEAIDRLHKAPPGRGKSPSVGGGIPMLLLSVLPPVIPRASWPSAEHCVKPSHGVTFNSEPKLDDNSVQQTPNVRYQMKEISKESLNENTGRLTVLGRLLNILGTKPSSRKTSSVSYSGGNVGIAAALKVHMGYFAGLVPGKSNSVSLESCNTHRKNDEEQEESLSRKGDDHSDEDTQTRSVQSLSHRVSFSIQHQHSQPILTFKEKVKGSPRFPHRIVPTCSLNALEERIKSNSCGNNIDSFRRKSQIQMTLKQVTAAQRNDSGVEKCRSLEDASNVLSTEKFFQKSHQTLLRCQFLRKIRNVDMENAIFLDETAERKQRKKKDRILTNGPNTIFPVSTTRHQWPRTPASTNRRLSISSLSNFKLCQ